MSLIELKNYLRDHGQASLGEMAAHFMADQETVRGMLEIWQRKGKVICVAAPKCLGCKQCGEAPLQIYQWHG